MTDRDSSHTSATFEQALKNWQQAGIITREQADAIRAFESGGSRLGLSPDAPRAPVTPSTLITYIGGFLVLVASGVFVGLGWVDMGNTQRFFWALLSVAIPWAAAYFLRRARAPLAQFVGTALLALGSLALMLLGFTVFRLLGVWPGTTDTPVARDRVNELMMVGQIATVTAAAIFAFRLNIPWMLLLSGVVGWFAWVSAMDLWYPRDELTDVPLWTLSFYGVVLVALGLRLNRVKLRQHAFWLFLSGLTATFLFLGIDSFDDALGPTGLVFLALAISAIVLSMWIDYRIFLLYGALGLYGWVSAFVIEAFGGSRPVAFGLIVLGVVVVAAGLAWQRWLAGRIGHHDRGPATATWRRP